MRTASILVANYNSREAVQLCIESIRHYDAGWPYRIIVHDDWPYNGIDAPYLARALEAGLIDELYTNHGERLGHGGSLNVLVNEKCRADYAAILDCDTYIKAGGWLRALIERAEANPTIAYIAGLKEACIDCWSGGYRTPFFTAWFSLLNMRAYRDGLMLDWRASTHDRQMEPYLSMFAHLYPPEGNAEFMEFWNRRGRMDACASLAAFPRNLVINDPGSQLYVKLISDNPKGYRSVNLPAAVEGKWDHVGHISMLADSDPAKETDWDRDQRVTGYALIRSELKKIREGK